MTFSFKWFYSVNKMKKLLVPAVLVFCLLFFIVFYISFKSFSKRPVAPSSQKAVSNSQTANVSSAPELEKEVTSVDMDTRNLKVPEPGEKPQDNTVGVPSVIYPIKNTSAYIRGYNLMAENNSFNPQKIIVYQNDVVRIFVTAKDKAYDFGVPQFGISLGKINQGETKTVEFQATQPGAFIIKCSDCQSANKFSATPYSSLLMVVPRSST